MLGLLADLKISARTVHETTAKIGIELQQQRDEQADAFLNRPITTPATKAEPPVPIACVEVDGGRMQTRMPRCGRGVHEPHWRENKNAGFFRMINDRFDEDPQPELPSCFSSRKQLSSLLSGLDEQADTEATSSQKPDLSWRPESVFRTCLSSLCKSDRFGELMSAEADRRGFYAADRRAFLGDGLPYNWKIRDQHFRSFTPILDFIHPIERLHETSRALWSDDEQAWQSCLKWINLCWHGDVKEVIGLLKAEQLEVGEPDEDTPEKDLSRVLAETIGYLSNNVSRMD